MKTHRWEEVEMSTLAEFMNCELAAGSEGTGRRRYWWGRRGDSHYVYLGQGDLNPDQANRLVAQFCGAEGWTVVVSPVRQFPRDASELTDRHAVMCSSGYRCVRREPMRLAYGAVGDTADNVWQLI